MNKFGLLKTSWGTKVVEYDPTRDTTWIHSSSEPIVVNPSKIDFDIDHVVDYLLSSDGRHSWGLFLPPNILEKIEEKIDPNDEWLVSQLEYLKKEWNYKPKYPNKKKYD